MNNVKTPVKPLHFFSKIIHSQIATRRQKKYKEYRLTGEGSHTCIASTLIHVYQDAILKLGPLPRLLNDISVALRNPQLHMSANQQPDTQKDRLFSRPSFNRMMSSDFQNLMMRDLNRYGRSGRERRRLCVPAP